MSLTISEEVDIAAPPEHVWPFLADPDKELEWRSPAVQSIEALSDGEIAPGSRYRGVTKVMGQTDSYETEVTEVTFPWRIAWRGTDASGPVMGSGSYELKDLGDGRSRMRLSMTYAGHGLSGRTQLLVMRLVAPRLIRRFLDKLSRVAGLGSADSAGS